MELNQLQEKIQEIKVEINRHIIGQDKLVEDTLICLLAGGNLLLEGVPGLGKTRLVSVLGQVLGLEFRRIQFTPDLMPADITGTNIYNKDTNTFEFQEGPVFGNIILADEINRATPKTQAAMLEAMQEKTVTVGGTTYKLPKPYMVMATQNPIEQEGTYPLPEAQMDRFMFKLLVEFPDVVDLTSIIKLTTTGKEEAVSAVIDGASLMEMQAVIRDIPISEDVLNYAMRLIVATHPTRDEATEKVKRYVMQGASPRGAQGIIQGAKVKALLEGRYNVSFNDIKQMARPILRHRIALNFEAMSEGVTVDGLITGLLKELEV